MFYFYDCSTGLELLHYHSCLFPLLLGLRLLPRVRPAHKDGRRTAPQHILMPTCHSIYGFGKVVCFGGGGVVAAQQRVEKWKSLTPPAPHHKDTLRLTKRNGPGTDGRTTDDDDNDDDGEWVSCDGWARAYRLLSARVGAFRTGW